MDAFDLKSFGEFSGQGRQKRPDVPDEKGANVPTYVLEYLLGMYCLPMIRWRLIWGLEKIGKILAENYVRPDQSEYVKSKIKENGQHTIS